MSFYGGRRINLDGSRNVYCVVCANFICTVSNEVMVQSAECVVCQLDAQGITPTEEQLNMLRSVSANGITMSLDAFNPKQIEDPLLALSENPTEKDLARSNYFFRAIVKKGVAKVKELAKNFQTTSTEIAKEKKRKRIFEQPLDKN